MLQMRGKSRWQSYEQEEMKALSITPSRWFNNWFEVPVIRRIPRCCQQYAGHSQANQNHAAHLRRRRRVRPFPAGKCANKPSFIGQLA